MELFAVLTEETVDGKVRGCPFPFIADSMEVLRSTGYFSTEVIDVRSIDKTVGDFEEIQNLLLAFKLFMKESKRFEEIVGVIGEVFFQMGMDYQKKLDSQIIFPPTAED